MTDTTSAALSDEEILQAYDSVPAHGNPLDVHLAGLRAVFALWFKHMEPAVVETDELSPDFTDTARAALLWVLWHHQGGNSPVGQPIRFALGMGQHDRLNEHQLAEAKRWGRLHQVNPSVFPRGPEPLTDEQISALADIAFKEHFEDKNDDFHVALGRAIEAAHGIGIKKGDGHA